jgi:hypothetical protein
MKYLTALSMITVSLIFLVAHTILEGFLVKSQLGILLTMAPFLLLGLILDYILNRNTLLSRSATILAKICPLLLFITAGTSVLLESINQKQYPIFNFLPWVFIALSFFMASFDKENYKKPMIYSSIGTGLVIMAYLFLARDTDLLNEKYYSILYYITYFMIFYAATTIPKLPILGSFLGLCNVLVLLWLRYFPQGDSKLYGWDYDIVYSFELLLTATLVVGILIRFIAEIIRNKMPK